MSGDDGKERGVATNPALRQVGYRVFGEKITPDRGENCTSGSLICPGLSLYHDAERANIVWCQDQYQAGWCLRLSSYLFSGQYLSLSAALPAKMMTLVKPGFWLEVDILAHSLRPVMGYIRLNTRRGSDITRMSEALILADGRRQALFEMGTDQAPGRDPSDSAMWCDLILMEFTMNALILRDLAIRLCGPEGA